MIQVRWFAFVTWVVLNLAGTAIAEVRLSFLEGTKAMEYACAVLRRSGCNSESLGHWRSLIHSYNASGTMPKLKDASPVEDGFYRFSTMDSAVQALPDLLANTHHEFEINCFDTVLLLSGHSLRARGTPDSRIGTYLAPHITDSGDFRIHPSATPRDSFNLIYSEWYREYSSKAIPWPALDSRIVASATLFTSYVLPVNVSEGQLESEVFQVLKSHWRERGLKFPTRMRLVLCHEVNYPERWFVTVHSGLLIQTDDRWTYFEKAGGRGPFVCLEFSDRSDLQTWFSGMFRNGQRKGYTHHFSTVATRSIQRIPEWNPATAGSSTDGTQNSKVRTP